MIALANASGQVAEKYAYMAYGPAQVTGAGTAAYRYTGRRFEPETGLYFYRARAYSPTLGRFLQTDPIGTKGGINLYAYVGNDPLDFVDPFGLCGVNGQYISGCTVLSLNPVTLPSGVGQVAPNSVVDVTVTRSSGRHPSRR